MSDSGFRYKNLSLDLKKRIYLKFRNILETYISLDNFRGQMGYEKEIKTALEAARAAGRYLLENQGKIVIKKQRENIKDYSTEQDLGSDKIISGIIKREFPNDMILSEEGEQETKLPSRMWIIDPLDGTRNYANGLPYYCVSIALFQDGETKVGVVYAPAYNDELFYAVKGGGAFLNDKPLTLFNPDQILSSSLVATGFAYFRGKELTPRLGLYGKVLDKCSDIVRYGAAALDLCHVAAGRLGAYYESGIKPWDVAAGMLILQEQNCLVTDYDGSQVDIFRKKDKLFSVTILVSKNGGVHSEMISIIDSAHLIS